jgi:putative flippase GtrA
MTARPLLWLRLVRFGLTGGAAAVIQVGLLRLLVAFGVTPILANALGFIVSAQVNFLASQALTWADGPPDHALGESLSRRWVRFHEMIAGTAVINMLVFSVARLVLPDLAASAAGIGVAAIVNYALADRIVFRRRQPAAHHVADAGSGRPASAQRAA